jgi:hypothetical protein
MKLLKLTRAKRVETEAEREMALQVLRQTYLEEKRWVVDVDAVFPASDLTRDDISWFIAVQRGRPVGVLRVLYDPPLEEYIKYGLKFIDDTMKLEALIGSRDIAEVGRFAVSPDCRKGIGVAMSLMRIATREVVLRGKSQLVTDVFENEQHSPYGFHTRIIGFRPIATHEAGELRFKGRRITLLLDLKAAYLRLKRSGNMVFRVLTKGWTDGMHARLTA